MKTVFKKSFCLAATACGLFVILFSSCLSVPVQEGQTVIIQYYSQGEKYFEKEYLQKERFELPEDPVREGFTFNGWWVTCEKGVVPFDFYWLKEHLDDERITVNARWLNASYTLEKLDAFNALSSTIQDGAIFGDYLFKFHSNGLCYVFSMETGAKVGGFSVSGTNDYMPHSNAVCFGNQYYDPNDEFPLLYANVYNNYNKDSYTDKRAGMLCVYRIQRDDTKFTSTLIQVIRVGFADIEPWRSKWNAEKEAFTDRSPWGNFIIDTDCNRLWAFVTRDDNHTTRFFSFDIPEINRNGVFSYVTLQEDQVKSYFDIPYSWYLQGACYHDGKIYSTEGMGTTDNPTRIRVVDLEHGIEDSVIDLYLYDNLMREAEFIDFKDDICYFGDYKKVNSSPTAYLYRISGV